MEIRKINFIGPILGRGRTSSVALYKLHHDNQTSTLAAIKYSDNSSIINNERAILHHLSGCPQLVQLKFDHQLNLPNHLLLEYAPRGTLRHLISTFGPLPLPQVLAYTTSILKGLVHIHNNDYVHSDIKPDNILIWKNIDVKIADFGYAKKTGEKWKGTTWMYTAPEYLTRDECEAPLDIYMLGCTVVEMVTGRMARRFDVRREGKEKLMEEIREGRAEPEIPEELSLMGKDFLGVCFRKEPERRWTALMLLYHPFLDDARRGGGGGGGDGDGHDGRYGGHSSDKDIDVAMQNYYYWGFTNLFNLKVD